LRLHGKDGGVEALKVAGLKDALAFDGVLDFGDAEEVVGFSEGGGDGLLDEQIEAGFEQRRGYGVVMDGRNRNGGGVDVEVGG
jgi:hypothetical protein